MSQVIARRYRPQAFDEVVGQEAIIRTLANAIERGRVGHGFIFSGQRGVGKTTVARLLAKALNCQAQAGPTPQPCGQCDACREIREGNAVDVLEIDAASNRGIEEIRALRERVRYRPARDRYKLFILDEAHQLTGDAFNALLKTLEEPPEWAVFVLATTEPEALPATIRSRCQHYAFRSVPFARVLELLRSICEREGMAADEEALGLIAEAGEGSVRDALSLLDQAIAYGGERLEAGLVRQLLGRVSMQALRDLLAAVASGDARALLEGTDAILRAGVGAAPLCRQLTQFARNMLVAQAAGGDSGVLELTDAERQAALECAGWFKEEELARFLQILLRTSGELRYGQQERLHLEMGLIKMLHARRLSGVEEVLAALGDPAGGGGAVRAAAPARGIPEKTTPTASGTATGAPRLFAAATPARVTAPATASSANAVPVAATPVPRLAAAPMERASAPGTAAATGGPATRLAAAAKPMAAAVAEPASMPAEQAGSAAGDARRGAVLAALEQQGRGALAITLQRAAWDWTAQGLTLTFSAAYADAATIAQQAGQQKFLREACREALQAAPEIRILAEAAPVEVKPQLEGTPEERAAAHPLLRHLRARIPAQVMRTRALEG